MLHNPLSLLFHQFYTHCLVCVYQPVSTIDWTLCPLKIQMLKPNPIVAVFGGRAFGRWLGYEGSGLMNGTGRDPRELPPSALSVEGVERQCLWTRKQALTRHWICWHLHSGLPRTVTNNVCPLSHSYSTPHLPPPSPPANCRYCFSLISWKWKCTIMNTFLRRS